MLSEQIEESVFKVICSYCDKVINKRKITIAPGSKVCAVKTVDTHGICTECMKKHFPVYYSRMKEKQLLETCQ